MQVSPPDKRRQRMMVAQIAETKRLVLAVERALAKNPATLLVTSAVACEGKSLLAAALATAGAALGDRRVLAIDLNWYRPTLHEFFGVAPTHSLETILDAELADLVKGAATAEEPDLICAPADHDQIGTRRVNGPELARRLISASRAAYDLVVVDSASVFPINRMMMDPVMLASLVDGVAVAVLGGSTPRHEVKRAYKTIETAGTPIIGAIVNHRQAPAGDVGAGRGTHRKAG